VGLLAYIPYAQRGKVVLTTEYFQGALYETDIREQEAPLTEDGQRQILGESIQFRREVSLPGIQDLQRLVTAAKL
jgi:hypothetical protein